MYEKNSDPEIRNILAEITKIEKQHTRYVHLGGLLIHLRLFPLARIEPAGFSIYICNKSRQRQQCKIPSKIF